MEFEYTGVDLIIAFIAVAILSVLIDKFTLFLEGVMSKIPRFPDKLEWSAAYALVLLISFIVCSEGHFSLFDYLNFTFNYEWQGHLLTALVTSGGSAFIRTQFGMISEVPTNLQGLTTVARRFFKRADPRYNGNTNLDKTTGSSYYGGGGGSYTPSDEIPYPEEEPVESTMEEEEKPKERDFTDTNRYSSDI